MWAFTRPTTNAQTAERTRFEHGDVDWLSMFGLSLRTSFARWAERRKGPRLVAEPSVNCPGTARSVDFPYDI
jgi:hypothetical protein